MLILEEQDATTRKTWRMSNAHTHIEHLLTRRSFLIASGAAFAGAMGTALLGCSSSDAEEHSGADDGNATDGNATASSTQKARDFDPSAPVEERVSQLMDAMSEHEKICQLFVVEPEKLTGVGVVVQAGDATREALAAMPVGGIIYFSQNLEDAEQTRTMLAHTLEFGLEASGVPPLLCIDEEGGTVTRVGGKDGFGAEDPGDMADIGAAGDAAQARAVAEQMGDYLHELGFNTDFAPVCDVANNPDSDTMRKRSFGSDPALVAEMVAAQVEGFTEAGVLCSAKHFPGIGAAVGDSHDDRIVYEGAIEELRATELVPFEAAIDAGVPLVMVGHMSLPAIVGDDKPACLSRAIVNDLLRKELGFEGIIITDSLSMGAITEHYPAEEAIVIALEAGCDLLLMPEDLESAVNAVADALDTGRLDWDQINASLRRVLTTKLERLASV